jgi:hypothetical protein
MLQTSLSSAYLYAGTRVQQDMVWRKPMRRSPQLRFRNRFLRQKGIRRISGGCYASTKADFRKIAAAQRGRTLQPVNMCALATPVSDNFGCAWKTR